VGQLQPLINDTLTNAAKPSNIVDLGGLQEAAKLTIQLVAFHLECTHRLQREFAASSYFQKLHVLLALLFSTNTATARERFDAYANTAFQALYTVAPDSTNALQTYLYAFTFINDRIHSASLCAFYLDKALKALQTTTSTTSTATTPLLLKWCHAMNDIVVKLATHATIKDQAAIRLFVEWLSKVVPLYCQV
jgi:hypothetical protein